jgi:hypothetical protein
MVELDEVTRRALLARDGPPAHARAEVLAGLRGRLGSGPGPDEPGVDPWDAGDLGGGGLAIDGSLSAGAKLVWAAKVSGATLGLAAAGLLSLKLGASLLGGVGGPSEGEGAGGATLEPAGAEPVAPVEVASTSDEPGAGEDSASVAHVGEAARGGEAARTGEADKRLPGGGRSDSSLAAELELVRAAKRLRAQPEAALAQLERHRTRFEAGVLAPERELLRIEMLCALGRPSEAAQARAEFSTRFSDSPLRARAGQACQPSGTDPAAAGDSSR